MNLNTDTYRLSDKGSFGTRALIAGVAGLAVSAVGWYLDAPRFYHAYLVAFTYWVSLALGALFFTMLHHLTGATWSTVLRRLSESLTASLPLMAIFSFPILFGSHDLYHWTHAEAIAHDPMLAAKSGYLNMTFFIIRLVVYFVVWSWLAHRLYRLSVAMETGNVAENQAKLRSTSAYGMVIFAFTITLAGFDWLMSLDPHWYSTIFGVYYFAGGLLGVVCLLTVLSLWLRGKGVLKGLVSHEHYHDLGKLIFGFIIFWAYIGFSQYLLIWYADIPEETVWYLDRWEGSWKTVSLLILFGHFAVPFVVMVFRNVKRMLGLLGFMAVWLLVMHWVDLYWLILPTYPGGARTGTFPLGRFNHHDRAGRIVFLGFLDPLYLIGGGAEG